MNGYNMDARGNMVREARAMNPASQLVIGGRGKTCFVELAGDPERWIAEKTLPAPPPEPFRAAVLEGSYDAARILNWATARLHKHEIVPGIYLIPTFDALIHLRLEGDQRWRHVEA